jgi:hypothetical protein
MNSIQLRAPIALTATALGTLPSRFEGIAYSGGVVPSYGVVIDLGSTTISQPMPLLHEHSRDRIIGAVTAASIQAGQIIVAGKLFSDIPGGHAEQIAQLAIRGAPFQMSVGLYGYTEEVVPLGRAVTVNSRTASGPTVVLRRGAVREVSIVTLGADPNTNARMFSRKAKTPGSLNARDIFARRALEAAGLRR